MKRRSLIVLTILCLLWVGSCAEAETELTETGEVWNDAGEHFCYEIEGDHAVLTRYWMEADKPQPAVIAIPAELDGYPLAAIGRCAFDNFDAYECPDGWRKSFNGEQVECIVIPEGVTVLKGDAFLCAHDIMRIELPSTLTEIEVGYTYTFHHVYAEICFPNVNPCYRVENGFLIDTRTDTLIYCSPSSHHLPLPRVRRIENSALEYYSQFQTVLEFPDSVEYIGSMNAYDCVSLETIIVPGSVTELADYALEINSAKEIILNEGLRRIGAFAFAETEITEITIPSTVEWIGAYAFFMTEAGANLPELNCIQETEEEYKLRCFGEDSDWEMDEEEDCDEEEWEEEYDFVEDMLENNGYGDRRVIHSGQCKMAGFRILQGRS